MATVEEILEEIEKKVDEAITLTVGKMSEEELEASRLLLSEDAAGAFREQCLLAHERIERSTPTSYTTNAELSSGEIFIIDDESTLDELGAFRSLGDDIGNIPEISPADLDVNVKLYAVAAGDDERLVFVRKTDPRMSHKAGGFLAIGEQRMKKVEGPVFAFSPDFDFIIGPAWVVVFNQKSFEMLFRDIGLVEKHISTWITGITQHFTMAGDSADQLRAVALRDSRTWRKLREIEKRGHLADVTLSDLKKYAREVGLDPKKIVVDGELVFDPSERFGFLHLLNEDLYEGPLTEVVFEAQRKSSTG